MSNFMTDQEHFWAGEFGNQYNNRNQDVNLVASNIALFSKIFSQTQDVTSVLELGANIGLNIQALHQILPEAALSAVEINEQAFKTLQSYDYVNAYLQSILSFEPPQKYDFVFTKGVLIHIDPAQLETVYSLLYNASSRYLCVAEYYNPSPVELSYRGHQGKLFKRDFAGDILTKFSDLRLVEYGFVYHRDNCFPQDDITWFLMEKA